MFYKMFYILQNTTQFRQQNISQNTLYKTQQHFTKHNNFNVSSDTKVLQRDMKQPQRDPKWTHGDTWLPQTNQKYTKRHKSVTKKVKPPQINTEITTNRHKTTTKKCKIRPSKPKGTRRCKSTEEKCETTSKRSETTAKGHKNNQMMNTKQL